MGKWSLADLKKRLNSLIRGKNFLFCATGPYDIPYVRMDGRAVYTNNMPSGAMRGFGAPQATFASELQIAHLAEALGIDAVTLRLRNCLRNGMLLSTGSPVPRGVSLPELIQTCARAAGATKTADGWCPPILPDKNGPRPNALEPEQGAEELSACIHVDPRPERSGAASTAPKRRGLWGTGRISVAHPAYLRPYDSHLVPMLNELKIEKGCGAADGKYPNASGLEARFMAEVGHAVTVLGLNIAQANELVSALPEKYEYLFARGGKSGATV